MSEKLNREQLNEAMEELVSGGDLVWANNGFNPGYRVWSDENPNVQYRLDTNNVIRAKKIVKNMIGASDQEKLQELKNQGIIFPM